MSSQDKPEPPEQCPCPPGCASLAPCDGGGCPVDWAHGTAEVQNKYLSTPKQGDLKLSWSNGWHSGGTPDDLHNRVGVNWLIDAFAYVTTNDNQEIIFVWSPGRNGKSLWFSPNGGGYEAKFGALQTLVLDGDVWRVTDPDGTVWEFSAIDQLISRHIAPGGQVTEYIKSDDFVVAQKLIEGDSIELRSFDYTNGLLTLATLYRGSVSVPGFTAVRKVALTYYNTTITGKGNIDDLKTVSVSVPQGLGWATISTSYYRYYTTGEANGFARGLKYVVGPSGYRELVDLYTNPDSATNGQVASVAEKAFQYDPTTRRVTLASTNGGTKTYETAYLPNDPISPDYNHWRLKATTDLPDGTTKILYANRVGGDMLLDHQAGAGRWIRYARFNDFGRTVLVAEPSAIDMSETPDPPYNDAYDDLNVQLNSSSGLIRTSTYFDLDDVGSSEAPGYLKDQRVQQGDAGTPIKLRKYRYTSRTVGSGPTESTVYPISKETVYRSDEDEGSVPVRTCYEYTWHTDSTQPLTVTTELPDIDDEQNGGDWLEDNTIVQHFDSQGRITQNDDARGYETTYEYDEVTGALSLKIQEFQTEYESDYMGRITEVRGPEHDVDGQTVQTVQWTVYLDADHEVRTAQGYLVGATYTLVNPVTITKYDEAGRVVDQIQAKRGSEIESEGALSPADTFAQTSWTRWTHHIYDDAGRLQATRAYHTIPSSGDGSSGTNYDETEFGYDVMGRRNYTKSPAGTISRSVFDPRGLVLSNWIGTDDTDATDDDPTGGSASGNNMQPVAVNTYDADAYGTGNDSLDGLLTKVTSPVDSNSGHDRVVEYRYDWRDRQTVVITTDGTHTFHADSTYDNLDRVTLRTESRVGSPDVLIAKSETFYDDRGRVYQAKRYSLSDAGTPGYALVDNMWYDENGNTIKSVPAGSEAFTKTTYDGLNQPTARYIGYWSGSGDDTPLNVDDDLIFEESHTEYDEASNAVFVTTQARWHDSTGNGALNGPSGSQPKSRDSYRATWYDGINRRKSTADYGTNNNAGVPTRPTSPPSSSATVLVSSTLYHPSGEVSVETDPAGNTVRTFYDAAGRPGLVYRNYGAPPTELIETTYTPEGKVASITAHLSAGNQVTTYTYGVNLAHSELASNSLLQQVTYPDGGDVFYQYNRQGECIVMMDQNETVHEYDYDKLGRQTIDRATYFGEEVDDAVQRIEWRFDNRKRLEHVTSYDAVTSGNITSDIQYAYNEFNQVVTEYQQHGAAVNTSTSPKVQYGYADGSTNTIRRTSCTYPNTRVVTYVYASGAPNKLSRVSKIESDATDIVVYEYLGLSQIVIQSYVEPTSDVTYTLATGSGSNPYAGLDRFGRIIDLVWEQ